MAAPNGSSPRPREAHTLPISVCCSLSITPFLTNQSAYVGSIFTTDPWDALSLEATGWDHPGATFMGVELAETEHI
jgi:hypothetical protein